MTSKALPIVHPNAAGMDLGSENYHISVDGKTVKIFPTFTESLKEIVKYLQVEKIKTVAMEATGVLWIPLYDILEESGFKVFLVNGHHLSNIPAQKSDFNDCRWLQKIHSYGLLRASFIPPDNIRKLRTYIRQRENHIDSSSQNILRMQKALELMNLKLHNVISDIKGKSGIKIIEAILSGERNTDKLLKLCDKSIIKNKSKAVKLSLEGFYKDEYIFLLQQSYEAYNFFQSQIEVCDKKVDELLKEITKDLPEYPETKAKPVRHNDFNIPDLHKMLMKLTKGKDMSTIAGLSDKTVLKLISEVGVDLSPWPGKKYFTSWLGLAPYKRQSGKMNRTKRRKAATNAAQIFREAAYSIANSKYLSLKGFYNRIKSKHGYKVAIKATARKLAELFYTFLTKGIDYVEKGLEEYERQYRATVLKNITKKAKSIGYQLVPMEI